MKKYTNQEIHNLFLDYLAQGKNSKGTNYDKNIEDEYFTILDKAMRDKYLKIIKINIQNDMDAEDVYHEAIIKMNLRKDEFDVTKNVSFNTWFEATILKYDKLSYKRDKSRKKEEPFSSFSNSKLEGENGNWIEETIASRENLEHDLDLKEEINVLRQSLEQLRNHNYQDTIIFNFFGGFTLKGIAEIMRLPLNTVKTRKIRGKEELLEIFNKFYIIRKMKDISIK